MTGLVVGYVQSGKTLSFETVIALARDNGYGIIIVLAGTKNNLLDQSEDRLKKDFGIDEGGDDWFPDRINLHLRRFDLGAQPRDPSSADVHDVTWFALNVPEKLRKSLLIEDR